MTGARIAFVGPSLPADELRRWRGIEFRPPARQGDIFRALNERPRAIALIDGLFESTPSVWHHELIAAAAGGARVYGAASMGALRAAELPGVVIPVGAIAQQYLRGAFIDDAHVALLHADASGGYRALTVPHVNVWATAQAAVARRVLSRGQARQLLALSEAQFYQERTWPGLFGALAGRWPTRTLERLQRFVARSAVDLKAADARACLRRLARAPAAAAPTPTRFSSFVRRVRPHAVDARPRTASVRLAEEGVRTLLLAAFARAAGLEVEPAQLDAWRARLPATGAEDERAAVAEALALEALVLAAPQAFIADGPSMEEGRRLALWRRAAVRG